MFEAIESHHTHERRRMDAARVANRIKVPAWQSLALEYEREAAAAVELMRGGLPGTALAVRLFLVSCCRAPCALCPGGDPSIHPSTFP
jgi:hypothetical protein